MKAIGDFVRDIVIPQRPPPARGERCLPLGNGAPLCLSEAELAAVGYRELTAHARRVGQFGLCRDDHGAWVYPPLKAPDETLEQMLERNAQTRRRLSLCAKRHSHGRSPIRGFDDDYAEARQ